MSALAWIYAICGGILLHVAAPRRWSTWRLCALGGAIYFIARLAVVQ